MHRYPRRPPPEPLTTNAVPAVLVGMGLWLVAGVVLFLAGDRWLGIGRDRWLWTCLAGLVVGGAVLGYEIHRRRRARAATGEDDGDEPEPVSDRPVDRAR